MLTMNQVLAYALSMVFYQRQICSRHARGSCLTFHQFAKRLAYWFVAPSDKTG